MSDLIMQMAADKVDNPKDDATTSVSCSALGMVRFGFFCSRVVPID